MRREVIGLVVVVGLLLRTWAVASNPEFAIEIKTPSEIATGGAYRWFKHPAYLGSVLIAWGLLNALCSEETAFVGTAITAGFLVRRGRDEDRLLWKTHGKT